MSIRTAGPRSIGLYMGIVFLSGTLVGAVGHMLYSTRTVSAKAARPKLSHEDARRRYVSEMETRLTLSGDQKQQLIGILDEFRAMYRDTHARIEPEMKRIQEAQRNKIRGMLSDTQRAEYEKLLEEKDRKRRSGDRPPGGGI